MRRLLTKAAAVLVLIGAAAGIGGRPYPRRAPPARAGSGAGRGRPASGGRGVVGGVSGPVDIIRDREDIPHIFAATKLDAFYGLGYVHAQDRLWQMEFQRRIGHGRLSEIFGAATVSQDRFLRTVGFGRAARSAWNHLPSDTKQQVDSYVAGVNAFI